MRFSLEGQCDYRVQSAGASAAGFEGSAFGTEWGASEWAGCGGAVSGCLQPKAERERGSLGVVLASHDDGDAIFRW